MKKYFIVFLIFQGVVVGNDVSRQSEKPECQKLKDIAIQCAKEYFYSITNVGLPSSSTMTCSAKHNTEIILKNITEQQPKCQEKENELSPAYQKIVLRLGDTVLKNNKDNFTTFKQIPSNCSQGITEVLKCVGIPSNNNYSMKAYAHILVKYTEMFFNGYANVNTLFKCMMDQINLAPRDCQRFIEKYVLPMNPVYNVMNQIHLRETLIECNKEVLNNSYSKCKDFNDYSEKFIAYSSLVQKQRNATQKEQSVRFYLGLLNITADYEPKECIEKYEKLHENCVQKDIGETNATTFDPDHKLSLKVLDLNECRNYNYSLSCTLDAFQDIQDVSCRQKSSQYIERFYQFILDTTNCTGRMTKDVEGPQPAVAPLNPLSSSSLTPAHVGFLAVGIIVSGAIVSSGIYIYRHFYKNKTLRRQHEQMEMNSI